MCFCTFIHDVRPRMRQKCFFGVPKKTQTQIYLLRTPKNRLFLCTTANNITEIVASHPTQVLAPTCWKPHAIWTWCTSSNSLCLSVLPSDGEADVAVHLPVRGQAVQGDHRAGGEGRQPSSQLLLLHQDRHGRQGDEITRRKTRLWRLRKQRTVQMSCWWFCWFKLTERKVKHVQNEMLLDFKDVVTCTEWA